MAISRKPRQILRLAFGVILAIGWVLFFLYIFNRYILKNPNIPIGQTQQLTDINNEVHVDETPVKPEDKDNHRVPSDQPRFISIPQLGIDRARIVQIGVIEKTGALDSPSSIYDAGWYVKSSKPGNQGAMLLDGHNGGPTYGGIFDKLSELKKNAEIIIERGDGGIVTYQVIDNRQMLVDEINDEKNPYGMSTMLNSIDSQRPGLNIITCVGEWIPAQKTFNKRVMLRAVMKK